MNSTTIKKMIGKQRNPFKLRDSDGDGVPNALDCRPHNPRKQGIIHDFAKRKITEYKERSKERAEEREMARAIEKEERKKQMIETARFRAKEKGRKDRAFIKGGGIAGSIFKGFDSTAKAIAPPRRTTKKRRKKQKKKSIYDMPSISDFKLFD